MYRPIHKPMLILFLLLTLLLTACSDPAEVISDWYARNTDVDMDTAELVWADSYEDLLKVIGNIQDEPSYHHFRSETYSGAGDLDGAVNQLNKDFSTTNIQVEGVDEADIIQTDGRYLYLVANQSLIVVDAADPGVMKVIDSVKYELYKETESEVSSQTPLDIYLDIENQRLVLLTAGTVTEKNLPDQNDDVPKNEDNLPEVDSNPPEIQQSPSSSRDEEFEPDEYFKGGFGCIPPYFYSKNYTTTRVFDISNKANLKQISEFSQEGVYVSSRMIESSVYVITQKSEYRLYSEDVRSAQPESVFPAVCDDLESGEWQTVPAERIALLPDGDLSTQITMTGFDIHSPESDPQILTVIGSTGQLYASAENLYIAASSYMWDGAKEGNPDFHTDIYRFRLSGGRITEAGQGMVPGTIINQFSMDEHNGFFRIATTTSGAWWGSENPSENHVYILDTQMNKVGEITGLAPGETIHSVRFMGDQAYLVTFRTTDPLFALDLSNPNSPRVMGELKIPGFSTYLHPYDEQLLIGFGYDVWVEGEQAMNLGLKVSLFDISDLKNPQEISSLILGGAGSHSEVLYDHKSLLFSKEKNIIAFPAALTPQRAATPWEYAPPVFQGLLVLSLDDSRELNLRGYISHTGKYSDPLVVPSNQVVSEWKEYPYYDVIRRALYVGDSLFTFSGRQIRATDLQQMKSLGSVELPYYDDEINGVFYHDLVVPR